MTDDVLSTWLDGRSGRHAAHVAACPACAHALGRYERLSELLRSAPAPEPPPGACAAIVSAVGLPRTPAQWIARRVLAPAAVLCILAVAWGSWMVASRGDGVLAGGIHSRASRRPVPEAWAILLSGERVVALQSTTALHGGFRFEHLKPGSYQVAPVAMGATLAAGVPVTLKAHESRRLPLWLDSGAPQPRTKVPVHGVVTNRKTGAPVGGALVVLVHAGGVAGVATTGADGRFALSAPTAGAISVWVYAAGWEVARLDAAAPASGRTVPLHVQLDGP